MFPIRYLSEETLALLDRNDASVEDWVDAVGEPTLTPLDFYLWSHPTMISYDQLDPSNLDFRIWLGWSGDGRIHFAGEFADDVYENNYGEFGPGFPFHGFDDSIGLLVDGDHTGGGYWGSHENMAPGTKPNMQAQYYQAISRVPSGPTIILPGTTDTADDDWWMVSPPFAEGGGGVVGENPTFWVIEVSVTCFDRMNRLDPEDSVVSHFTEGKTIGFDVGVYDHDLKDSRRHAWYMLLDPDELTWAGADDFVDGLLVGPGGEYRNSAVQSVSWARIKASLQTDQPRSQGSFRSRD